MTLPQFLVIGAMKAGTTTLFQDLKGHPSVYMASDKEINGLADDSIFTPKGIKAYEKHFLKSESNQICGEGSTNYSKVPDIENVPERAHKILGNDIRLIYLVRNPIARLISQYNHHVNVAGLTTPIDEAIHELPRLVNYSKYAMQLQPWISEFGLKQIKVIVFEDYVKNRVDTFTSVCNFLGIPVQVDHIESEKAFNKGAGRPKQSGLISDFSKGKLYHTMVRKFIPQAVKDSVRKHALPKSEPPQQPTKTSVNWVVQQLLDDSKELCEILGWDTLPWNLEDAVKTYGK